MLLDTFLKNLRKLEYEHEFLFQMTFIVKRIDNERGKRLC